MAGGTCRWAKRVHAVAVEMCVWVCLQCMKCVWVCLQCMMGAHMEFKD